MADIFQLLRDLRVGGINSLEWAGIICTSSFSIYFVLNLRDRLSGMCSARNPTRGKKQTAKPSKEMIKQLPLGKETILVVDDDPAVLRAHSRLISKLGYNTQRALGGQEAIDYIRNNHADLIILDLLMPGLDGIETFRSIKDINPYQKAIVLSGFAGPSMVNAIKTLGVNTYLVKPAELSILAKAIRDEIDRT